MPTDRRGEAEIRRDLATEREQLSAALADLRRGVAAKRRLMAVAGGTLAAAVAARALRRVAGK